MASAVDSRLAYARLSAVATASRLPTANRGSNNSYTTSWDTTPFVVIFGKLARICSLAGCLDLDEADQLIPIGDSVVRASRKGCQRGLSD